MLLCLLLSSIHTPFLSPFHSTHPTDRCRSATHASTSSPRSSLRPAHGKVQLSIIVLLANHNDHLPSSPFQSFNSSVPNTSTILHPTLIDGDYASPARPRLRTLSPPVSAFVLQTCRTFLDASSSSLVPPPFLDTVLARACKQHERRYISQRDPRSACWLRSAARQRVRMPFLPFTARDAVLRPATRA